MMARARLASPPAPEDNQKVGRVSHAVTLGLALMAGCAGTRTAGNPCAGVTCAPGRICVEGHCVAPDGSGLLFSDGALDGLHPWPDGSPDSGFQTEAGADSGAADTGAADTTKPDLPSLCPDPTTAAGGYSGSFIDGAGGTLAKGKITFTLTASTAQVLTLSGALDGTALPGLMNYKIKGTLTGLVNCGVIASTLKGTLEGYAFDGLLNGVLNGKSASGLWNGQQAGGGLAVTGTWTATHN
jgi:hypothetical protein